jgi:hypothetical protein
MGIVRETGVRQWTGLDWVHPRRMLFDGIFGQRRFEPGRKATWGIGGMQKILHG